MNEHLLPITMASEEEWQATMRYADEHVGEWPGQERQRADDLPSALFKMATQMNRLYAQSLGVRQQ